MMPNKSAAAPMRVVKARDISARLFLDLRGQFAGGELARRLRRGVAALNGGHDEEQMHIQAELDHGLGGINDRPGQRLNRGQSGSEAGLGFSDGRNEIGDAGTFLVARLERVGGIG